MNNLIKTELAEIASGLNIHFNHYGGKRLPFLAASAKGIRHKFIDLEDIEQKEFEVIDASGAYASACLGASNEFIKKIIIEAIENVGYVTDEIGSLERVKTLLMLFGKNGIWSKIFPEKEYHVSGRNSGSEGIELALRLVMESRIDKRNYRILKNMEKKKIILAFEGAWHGWTNGLVPLLNRRHYKVNIPTFDGGNNPDGIKVMHIPFGESGALKDFFSKYGDEVLAVFIEPVQGDAGILLPPSGYLREVSKTCSKFGALLVADEVLTFAKTGLFFGMRDENGHIPTDITVIGKSLGMGIISTSMVIARRQLTIRNCGAVATSDLRPITCSIIKNGMQYIIEKKLIDTSLQNGEYLRKKINELLINEFPDIYLEVRGLGYMNGIELTEKSANNLVDLRKCLIRAGVYVEFMAGAGKRSCGLRYVMPTMRIAPPLITTMKDIDEIVARIRKGTIKFKKTI